ncbi:MAG: EAL domain-containing protein [Anaerovibrio sp.]|nr:EAL domain-containing protein [Anaerovibrio sp.]
MYNISRNVKPISVNVSRIDLYDPKLVKHLVELRQRYDIPPEYLELEITESAYTDDPEQIVTITRRLSEAGFLILMDDFGTGYSSLNMLKDLQVDVLKLDMGFLKSSDNSPKGGSILAAIMQMARSLNMQTIAEGVETREQVEFLKSIGCQFVQGFYYSRPLPAQEFEKLI